MASLIVLGLVAMALQELVSGKAGRLEIDVDREEDHAQ